MNQQVQKVVEKLVQGMNLSHLRILEIGAGTGGTTAHLLPHLREADYVFTDISPLFLARAKARFASYPNLTFPNLTFPNLTFQRLDIEQPVDAQGFKQGDYDLVIAANVLHATADIEQTLRHVRSLLTPNGQLILLEGTQPLLWLDLIFGITEGWWKQPTHPLRAISQWQQHLQAAGFNTAIPLVSSDNPENSLSALPQSIIVATQPLAPVTQNKQNKQSNWLILAEPTAELGDALAQQLKGRLIWLEESFSLTEMLHRVNPLPDRIVYLVGRPAVSDWTSSSASSLGALSGETLEISPEVSPEISPETPLEAFIKATSTGLLTLLQAWSSQTNIRYQLNIVTQGATAGADGLPQSVMYGLARVIELEYPALSCRRIDLDPSDTVGKQLQYLCQELKSQTNERSVVYRQQERRVLLD